jgi:hypothetical protein
MEKQSITVNTFPSSGYVDTLMRTVFGLGAVSRMNDDGVQLSVDGVSYSHRWRP